MSRYSEERRYADQRSKRERAKIDPLLARNGYTPSFHLTGAIHLFTCCKTCGSLILLTNHNGVESEHPANVHRRWHERQQRVTGWRRVLATLRGRR